MPGVSIRKGARIRRAIVEEGVEIPAGFQVGFDEEYDRHHHFVTDSGVVVLSDPLQRTKPTIIRERVTRLPAHWNRKNVADRVVA